MVQVGEGRAATLRIEAPTNAMRAVTTIEVDPKHPPKDGVEVNVAGQISLARGEVKKSIKYAKESLVLGLRNSERRKTGSSCSVQCYRVVNAEGGTQSLP